MPRVNTFFHVPGGKDDAKGRPGTMGGPFDGLSFRRALPVIIRERGSFCVLSPPRWWQSISWVTGWAKGDYVLSCKFPRPARMHSTRKIRMGHKTREDTQGQGGLGCTPHYATSQRSPLLLFVPHFSRRQGRILILTSARTHPWT